MDRIRENKPLLVKYKCMPYGYYEDQLYNNVYIDLYTFFLLCHLENNKITYRNITFDIKEIIENINNSVVLIFNEDYYHIDSFVRDKKYLRYFKDEKLNFEKTSYVC